MSYVIDWSKAPEWADKNGITSGLRSRVWFNDEKYTYADDQPGGHVFLYTDACTYSQNDFSSVTSRPQPTPWTGEGLPPVGVVCEVRNAPGGWGKATIKYQGKGIIVWLWDRQDGNTDQIEFASCPDRLEFRPIRTPEQIAADDRNDAIAAIVAQSLGRCDSVGAAYLYDAGYRKP